MARKITQLAATSAEYNGSEYLYAACDDGSIWRLVLGGPASWRWERLPNLPHDQTDNGETR